jgi:uncharacterized membrane protein YbhN (UPF0104 family)
MNVVDALPAHLVCLALVATDIAARTMRLRLLLRHLGGRVSWSNAVRVNLLGDAAAELTPFRMAGEPSRFVALLRSSVRAEAALLTIGAELALSYAFVAVLVITVSWAVLPEWWSSIGPAWHHLWDRTPAWAIVLLPLALGLLVAVVSRPRGAGELPRALGIRPSVGALRAIGPRIIAAFSALTAVNIASRVGVLWVLASMLPNPPGSATVLVGSFLLLFGQAFAPTPSGIGVVEMGVLGGAAGAFGSHAGSILIYWRTYTAVLPILLATVFALPRFGVAPLMTMFKRGRSAAATTDEVPAPPVLAAD